MITCAITGSNGVLGKKLKRTLPYKFYEFKKDIRNKKDVEEWVLKKNSEYSDPLMMGGVLMKATIELYLSQLSDENINHLLDVVAESIQHIRRQSDFSDLNKEKRVLH